MNMTQKNEIQATARMDALFERVSVLIEQARRRVMTSVNIAEVCTKYSIGQYIVEDEQQGNARAEYEWCLKIQRSKTKKEIIW